MLLVLPFLNMTTVGYAPPYIYTVSTRKSISTLNRAQHIERKVDYSWVLTHLFLLALARISFFRGEKKNRINVLTPTYFHLGIQIIVVDVVFHLIPSPLCVRSILSTYIFLSLCKGNIKIQISFYNVCFGVGYEFSVLFSRLWKLINNWSNGLVLQAFSSCVT